MTLYIIYLTPTHPKLSKNVCVYLIIPSSLFTTILFYMGKNSVLTGAKSVILWCLEWVNTHTFNCSSNRPQSFINCGIVASAAYKIKLDLNQGELPILTTVITWKSQQMFQNQRDGRCQSLTLAMTLKVDLIASFLDMYFLYYHSTRTHILHSS